MNDLLNDDNVANTSGLMPTQQGMLYLALAAGSSRAGFEQQAALYRGRLDVASLRRAWEHTVDRHEILRTVFAWDSGETPRQIVLRRAPLEWREEDWRGRAPAAQEAAWRAFLIEDRERAFDLVGTPPLRVSVLRTAEGEHRVVWSFHPILVDLRSAAMVGAEVAACYLSFAAGQEPPLEPPLPYRRWVAWLEGRDPAEAQAFWQGALVDATRSRLGGGADAASGVARGEERIELPEATGEGLRSLARDQGLALETIFHAVWALLLSRHLGEDEVLFGAVLSGRTPGMAGVETVVGRFSCPLPVRVRIDEGEPFLALLKRLRGLEAELERFAHAPLIQGRIWSGLARGTPVFETVVAFEDAPRDEAPFQGWPGCEVNVVHSESGLVHPLHLRISAGRRFRVQLSCGLRSFDSAIVLSLMQQIPVVLDQFLACPELPVGQISLVTPESRAILPNLADPLESEDFPPVTALFEQWVGSSPLSPALRHRGRVLSYAGLSERARAVARALRASGCQREDVVAIDGRPGFGLIAGLLGVLFAGGVALMVDRRLPLERRRLMCREAGASYLVWLGGESAPEGLWTELTWKGIVSVGLETGDLVDGQMVPGTEVLPEVTPEDAAYVFFTSGTTGVPKGVLGVHRGLSHFVTWQGTTFGVGPGDRSSQLTGLSFDVVLREIFLPLTSGATLCLPDEPEELGAERVLPWMEREGITTLHTVPALAETWLMALPQGVSLDCLHRVFFAGEPLSGRLVARWRAAFGTSAQIVNLYGPTETTLAKCFFVVPAEVGEAIQPVGRPLPRSQALVLAEGSRPCGAFEWGEIAIRTPYRTRGYINVPGETARRFRPNPLRGDERDLLYHTGDRGRFRADGVLEISGRLDDQVKINGARVEPGEIAAALGEHRAVRQAVVLARKDNVTARLVAYVVSNRRPEPTAEELKAFLAAKLPEFMIPSSFAFLERMPLTPNGKVDRKALSRIESVVAVDRAEPLPPGTATEELLAGIWAEVLGLERVGVDDNFFDLGGNSLLMMAVLTRARLRGLELEQLALFRHPTVRALADHLSGRPARGPDVQSVRDRAQRQREALSRQRRPGRS